MIALTLETNEARDMGDQDRRETMREMSASIAAHPLESDMPRLGRIEHDLHVDHSVLLVGRKSVVEPFNEGLEPAKIPCCHRGDKQIVLGCGPKPAVLSWKELLVEPGFHADPVLLPLVPMAREGKIGMLVAKVVDEHAHLGLRRLNRIRACVGIFGNDLAHNQNLASKEGFSMARMMPT